MVERFFLAVETSQDCGSLLVGQYHESPKINQNYRTLAFKEWTSDKTAKVSHAESLNQYCIDALKESKIDLKDLNLLIINIGPGSFTGVRVGINFVRSLAYSLQIPVQPISSLEILAHRQFLQNEITVESTLPSLGTEYYYAKYEKKMDTWVEIEAPQLRIGSAPSQNPLPWSAKSLAQCAFSLSNSSFCEWKQLFPLYLRGSQAEEKMKRIVKT